MKQRQTMFDGGSGLGRRLGNGPRAQGQGCLRCGAPVGILLLALAACQSEQDPSRKSAAPSDSSQPAAAEVGQVSPERLAGRWVRMDGGYMLELSGIAAEGQLHAAYFNPQPIHVARAEWSRKDGRLNVFVELRDVNYPGSTYTLQYDPESNRLSGIYFQAVTRESYQIEFQKLSGDR